MNPPKYGWASRRDAAREAVIGIVIGIAYSIVETAGAHHFPDAHTLVRNAVIALAVLLITRGGETLLSGPLERSRRPGLLRILLYSVFGWIAYYAAIVVLAPFQGFEREDFAVDTFHFRYALAIVPLIAIIAGSILHLNRVRNDALRGRAVAESELEIARAMQRRLLPPEQIERDGFRLSARTQPAHIVGGDFYDVIGLPDGTSAIVIADVAGKGIAASLIMASCKAMLPFLAGDGGAAAAMTALNARLCDQLERREFVAMLFARLDPRSGALEMVNAGMPDPLLLPGGPVSFTGDRLPLGARRASRYESTRVTLPRGDRLAAFSDGLPEALVGGAPLGYERAEAIVRSAMSIDDVLASLRGASVDDDLTILILERT